MPNQSPPAMPATLTTASRSTATRVAASSRGSTSRWSGLTPMTSIALISSRMRRDPRSAHIADPPAPAMSSAVATGACSRTTANTMAAPSCDCAPICWRSEPTSSAMTMPKGMERRIRGSVVTRARNQHWSKNSETGTPLSGACRRASNAVANMLPVSRTAEAILPSSVIGRLGPGSVAVASRRPLGVPSRRAISSRHRDPGATVRAPVTAPVSAKPSPVLAIPLLREKNGRRRRTLRRRRVESRARRRSALQGMAQRSLGARCRESQLCCAIRSALSSFNYRAMFLQPLFWIYGCRAAKRT